MGFRFRRGNHWFPLTDTNKDTVAGPYSVDDRDYNITYKFGVSMMACLLRGQYCDYVYGNGPTNSYGATTQTDMGRWSDGTPVTPLALIQDPVLVFPDLQFRRVVKAATCFPAEVSPGGGFALPPAQRFHPIPR